MPKQFQAVATTYDKRDYIYQANAGIISIKNCSVAIRGHHAVQCQ
jgi:hypothetical protein